MIAVPTGLAVGLALTRYAAIRRRFAPRDVGPPFLRYVRGGFGGGHVIKRGLRGVPGPARAALRGSPGSVGGHMLRRMSADREREILARVAAVPAGFVRSYGDVSPGAPRLAGAVLSANHDATLPWHRIVRADGSLAKGARQRALLEAEGVPFRGERVDMRVARLPELGGEPERGAEPKRRAAAKRGAERRRPTRGR
jgi:methylated-DNA-protein-cysteine methyltransferase related protein